MLKKWLLMFVRRFYQADITYIDKLIKEWTDSLVRWLIDILFNGFVGYLALFGITYLFPYFSDKIFLGNTYWHLPFTIILIGIVSWFLREFYRWIQSNKKSIKGVRT